VIPATSISRRQLKSTQIKDRVMQNNIQVEKKEVEDHRRNFKFSNNNMHVTACNDSLKAKTLNVNFLMEIIMFIVDSGCTKHMTGNLKLLTNFVEKFIVVLKSSAVTTVDASDKCQQPNITPSTSTTIATHITQLNIQTTPEPTTQAPTINADENINQAENIMFDEDNFINPFGTPIHEVGESPSRHVDPSNMHTFYQQHTSEYHWTRDHPLEQVHGNPS
ncbi:hypothetical protein Tco_0675910, partial [Tanacetum coccineum]